MILFSKNALILWMLWPVQLLNGHKPLKKIMAGLLNQYLLADNTKALNAVKWMDDYFNDHVWNFIRKYTVERHYQSLNEEVGGMNDVLYRCFSVTVSNQQCYDLYANSCSIPFTSSIIKLCNEAIFLVIFFFCPKLPMLFAERYKAFSVGSPF